MSVEFIHWTDLSARPNLIVLAGGLYSFTLLLHLPPSPPLCPVFKPNILSLEIEKPAWRWGRRRAQGAELCVVVVVVFQF